MNIVLYTNIMTPYRKNFYDVIYKECACRGDQFTVLLMAATEPNRNWNYEELKTEYAVLLKGKTISVSDIYIHFNRDLKGALRQAKPDILICAGSYLCPGVWQAVGWARELGYKAYFWSESHLNEKRDYTSLKTSVREMLRKRIYSKFDGFWYAGELSKQFIKQYAKETAEYIFVPNLVEENVYRKASEFSKDQKSELRHKMNIPDGSTVFFCPARLSKVKGIDLFLPLLKRAAHHDSTIVLIAGEGELRNDIISMAHEMELDVRLLGSCEQNMMVKLYVASDFFLLPSISDPNPLSCIEALWAGLPLLISEHCGNHPEVICSGKNGFVFDYTDENVAICTIERAITTDEDWRETAKIVSLQIASKNYQTKTAVDRLLDALHT